ncbi:MAG: hypothetical protein HFF73_15025 [Oscillospiraceae bacterium]|nr:hypothetical protein [Oscillospiraceae bacterium]
MNDKWHEIKDQLLKLQLPQEGIDPLTFLLPKEWHIENYNGREVLVVAEEVPKYNGSICLVVDLEGKVYRAILPMYEIYQYCSNSFEQFLLISTIAIIKKTNNRQSWQTNGGNREEKRK